MVTDQAIGITGRAVRCASCGHQWFQEAIMPAPAPEELPPLPPEPVISPAQFKKRQALASGLTIPLIFINRKPPRWMRPLCLLMAIIVLILTPFADRKIIMQSHPEFAFILEPFGIYYTDGLAIADIDINHLGDNEARLEISCNIVNESKGSRTMPNLRFTVLDAEGATITRSANMTQTGKNMIDGDVQPCNKFAFDSKNDMADRIIIDLADPFDMRLRKN